MNNPSKHIYALSCALFFAGACDLDDSSKDAAGPAVASSDIESESAAQESLASDLSFRRGTRRGRKPRRERAGRRGRRRSNRGPRMCPLGGERTSRLVHVAFSPTWEDRGDLFDEFSHAPIEIEAGERVVMRLQNLGTGDLSNAMVNAYFAPPNPETQAEFESMPGFGWGTYRGGLVARRGAPDAHYSGVLFGRLEANKTASLAPNLVQSCSQTFPYDATLLQLDVNLDVLCRSGRQDGRVSFKLIATRSDGSERLIRDIDFEACLDRNADITGADRFSDPAVQLAFRSPPRGVTNFQPFPGGGGYRQY